MTSPSPNAPFDRSKLKLKEIAPLGHVPATPVSALSDEQAAALFAVIGEGLRVSPPHRYLIASPATMQAVAKLSATVRASDELTVRGREIVILVTGVHLKSEFVIAAHHRDAIAVGVPKDAADAIVEGRPATFANPNEQAIYDIAMALHTDNPVPADKAARAEKILGRKLVSDIIAAIGSYAMICYITRMVGARAGDVGPIPPGLAEVAHSVSRQN